MFTLVARTVLSGALLFTGFLAQTTIAWNTDVHCQIGHMATELLSPYTHRVLKEILKVEPYYQTLGQAGAWADAFAHTAEGRFSARWHWIDSSDTPPQYCFMQFPQDCGIDHGGCVVSAIANQTQILQHCVQYIKNGTAVPDEEATTCVRSLKWVIHFLGDIAQPLHACGRARGGNGQNVTFAGKSTELHAVWDGSLLYSYAETHARFSQLALAPYFRTILTRIQLLDNFLEPTASFIDCSNPSVWTAQTCALSWSLDSNRLNCRVVWNHDFKNGSADLSVDGYASAARNIVEMQVAKAALRLATWLNRIVLDDLEEADSVTAQEAQDVEGNMEL